MAYTTIDDSSLYFRVKTYSGSSSDGNAVTWDETHANMQPDWLWLKNRTDAQEHWLADVVRGTGKFLESNSDNAESSDGASGLASFDTNGFTLNNSARTNRNTMVGWGWKAGGTASSNTDGSITSSVSANTTAGFSIVSFTGTGSNATVGHGLGTAPSMVIIKRRDSANDWRTGSDALTNWTKHINLNTTAAESDLAVAFNSTAPTSSVFSVGTSPSTNASSGTFIAYCFTSTKGYSKIGSYTGNGNADGTFIYLGFRPAWIMFKRTDSSVDWTIYDNKRLGYNENNYKLRPNLSNAEYSTSGYFEADILSNGFKIRYTGTEVNGVSGQTYIYCAWAEAPAFNLFGAQSNAR